MTIRIGLLMPHYSARSSSYWPLVARALTEAGAVVDVVHPPRGAVELATLKVDHDLYVLRKLSGFALSLAGALHELGAAILNPYSASAALRDKIVGSRVLQEAGIPIPATYVASDADELLPHLEEGPLIVKPYLGAGGHHIHVVRTAVELAAVPVNKREPVFAQRYHPPHGRDRKIYAIGADLFGVKKIFPRRTDSDKLGEPFHVGAELADIARRCGRAFGVDLYGVDMIESGGRPYVVDVASVPGYKGVPDAPARLARHILAAAERARRGEALAAAS